MARITKEDTIVSAYAQSAAGPGWANRPIWVVVRNREGVLREECIQPEAQTSEMLILFQISQVTHGAMVRAVEAAVALPKKKKAA